MLEVQEAERHRIALELHDVIGQTLTGLKLTLEMGKRLPTDDARLTFSHSQSLVNQLMARVRNLSLDLRLVMLDDLGLLPTLLWHIEHYMAQTQVRVNIKHSGIEGRRFPPEIETAAYRIVQEALTNIAPHAGAGETQVRIWTDGRTLSVYTEDEGAGFDPDTVFATSNTSGLTGMRERAILMGGHFTVESRPQA